jgi:hypothetical protein
MCATCGCNSKIKSVDKILAAKKTGASTPAPKKDRIKGSKTNPKGSAASGKSKAIKFSDRVETSLKNKVKEHNEKAAKGRRATLGMLKAVYRRGAGAFSTSHRPGKSRDQWAMARVNAYLKLLKSGKPSNPNYKQDNDLLPAAHPRSSKKSASVMGLVAGARLVPEERDLAEALLEVVEKHGKFNEDQIGVWAGYSKPEDNEVASIGVKCANCVFYRGGSECAIISLPVEPEGKCRFAVIPEGVVNDDAVILYDRDNLEQDIDDLYYASELSISLKDVDEYSSPEEAILALTEYLGLGYEAEPAIRAAWLRGVNDGESPYHRALSVAEYASESKDSDLLPMHQKGVSE